MDYSIQFYGHLKGGAAAKGLPPMIQTSMVFRTVSQEEHPNKLKERDQMEAFLDGYVTMLSGSAGMSVDLALEDDAKSDLGWGRGKFIPWHMIRYVSYSVRKIVGEMPAMDDPKVVLN